MTAKYSIRKEAIAGSFYPENEEKIIDFIHFVENTKADAINKLLKSIDGQNINGLIVPHAGWIYSGRTALMAYKILEAIKPAEIALLGPSHKFPINRILADEHNYWSTPLGLIKLLKDHHYEKNITYHAYEHSLEVQAPFIKYCSDGSSILPLLVGEVSDGSAADCAQHLYDNQYFTIISTDLSHYNPLEIAKQKDIVSINSIQNNSSLNLDACGRNPLKIAYEFNRLHNTKPRLIDYSTSAEISGDTNNVVGYASFWF
jgi:AmmeMemoRadiSam system protein B